jgi:hypothetical protein
MFGMWEEAAQAKFLMHYIHETWEWEQKLEARADFIQTESSSLAERLRELRMSGKLPNIGREEGPDVENDGGAGTSRG